MRTGRETSVKTLIYNLKNGALSWVSPSGFHISVAGLVGVAGFILALRKDGKFGNLSSALSWLSERGNGLEKVYLVPGLQNLGNNCFLNVILQAVASCTYFQPLLQKVIEECEKQDEHLPLTVALADLLEELCLVAGQRVVLSPQQVMIALELYIPNFNLTSQQDAAEAFLHLLSSLREEFSECYSPNQSSLVDAFAAQNCRILSPKRTEGQSEQKRWQKHFFGPFDGILGSILTCQTCSSQISLDYQFFHSLPLSPVLSSGSTIIFGCTLEDCLKQFLIAEQIENYHCSHCWHIAAIKYLYTIGATEMETEKLGRCSAQDSCDCQSLLHLQTLPWSNSFSHTLKQLSISRCPMILCIQLQRASINEFGELVKLQGHIAFPLILDLLPFMKSGVGIKDLEDSWQSGQAKLQQQGPSTCTNCVDMIYDVKMLNSIYGRMGENRYTKVLAVDELGCTSHVKAFQGESELPKAEGCSNTICTDMHMQIDDKVNVFSQSCPSETCLYHLVSVVEHFGRVGSGHYTVYRSLRAESHKEDPDKHFETPPSRWFCISDSERYGIILTESHFASASSFKHLRDLLHSNLKQALVGIFSSERLERLELMLQVLLENAKELEVEVLFTKPPENNFNRSF